MKINKNNIKGRGAQDNKQNRYSSYVYDKLEADEPDDENHLTKYIDVFPKTIINTISSPDIPMDYSVNPYEGCEHGCVYCYARNTHAYWGYGAGLDFERIILIKKSAPELLRNELNKKNHRASPIMLSGNTDCYQPIERKLEITRDLLKILLAYKHPVGVITKNSLIERDLDLYVQLHALNLVQVVISITTLNEELRRQLEPRTSTASNRLKTVELFAQRNIPVMVNIAPIIPGLTDIEIMKIAELSANAGALGIAYNIMRLPEEVEHVFTDWVRKTMPDRADKILNQTAQVHGGTIQDTKFGRRMRGEGVIAASIKSQIQLARKKYFSGREAPQLRNDLFVNDFNRQQKLF